MLDAGMWMETKSGSGAWPGATPPDGANLRRYDKGHWRLLRFPVMMSCFCSRAGAGCVLAAGCWIVAGSWSSCAETTMRAAAGRPVTLEAARRG